MPGGEDVRKVSRQDIQLVSTLIMIPLPFSSFILLPSFFSLYWSLSWYSGVVSRINHAETTLNRTACIIGFFSPACLVTL